LPRVAKTKKVDKTEKNRSIKKIIQRLKYFCFENRMIRPLIFNILILAIFHKNVRQSQNETNN